jgi:uncharacterized protein YxjI
MVWTQQSKKLLSVLSETGGRFRFQTDLIWKSTSIFWITSTVSIPKENELQKSQIKWFDIRDTYGVEISPEKDDALILAITVSIDQMAHD